MQRDYYEVLQVDKNATLNEIRASFRRLALIWHPDKNPDRVEEATVRFKELQHAYSVLSDDDERAWYDAHKESILRGQDVQYVSKESNRRETGLRKATNVPLFDCFSPNFYNGYQDDAKGFYTKFREVFETLDREERICGEDVESDRLAPSFGRSDSSWDQVAKFYTYWENFQTKKSFAFLDNWNPTEAPNREVRRAMEKENRLARQEGKKEFVATVRSLVSYVKRRDKRVARRRQEEMEEENRRREMLEEETNRKSKEAQELRRKLQAERQRLIDDELVHLDELLEELDLENTLNTSPTEEAVFFCTVCKKSFRSLSQWENHEASKKHSQKVRKSQEELLLAEEDGSMNTVTVQIGNEKLTLEEYCQRLTFTKTDDDISDSSSLEEDLQNISHLEHAKEENLFSDKVETELSEKLYDEKSFKDSSDEEDVAVKRDTTHVKKIGEESRTRKPRRNKSEKKKEKRKSCNVCSEVFASRNKLFEHLEETGHARRLSS
eukprot:jgi/Galph1/1042/GphlegSOOS_G5749.1